MIYNATKYFIPMSIAPLSQAVSRLLPCTNTAGIVIVLMNIFTCSNYEQLLKVVEMIKAVLNLSMLQLRRVHCELFSCLL